MSRHIPGISWMPSDKPSDDAPSVSTSSIASKTTCAWEPLLLGDPTYALVGFPALGFSWFHGILAEKIRIKTSI